MALPRSGQLGLSQINSELGRRATSTLSLDGAENGLYGTINGNSRSRPSSTNPAAISEWYSYDHDAGGGGGGGLTLIQLGYSGRAEGSRIGEVEACSQFSSEQVPTWFNEDFGNWWQTAIFATSNGLVYATVGWYSDQPYAGGFTVRYWRGSSWSSNASLCAL
jgi:hypothetical protein